ncbi:ribonuclease [Ideonella oryzae]|uniref:Ribonuclease n=1 Tax=Ideonella oryzae TaxID=2937441 RepID=A0ABT1BRZ4_9BURK|nr:ribonuclease [Ideonella oryzae]MCO5978307.1 ribonuclease [Ideonella oryzae]
MTTLATGAVLAWVVALPALSGLALAGSPAWARESSQAASTTLPTVALADLPPQAQATERLVRSGGPFPYEKDGIVFGNRERLLPRQTRGYYHEYTVPTPGARDRGARRLVCGGRQPRNPDACFYTDDHYASFRRVLP